MKRVTIVSFLLAICYLPLAISYADIPKTINYQGKLTDKQGYALDGSYNITFRLYDAPTGGTLLWQEQHTSVSVSRGLFSVLLGTITPLNLPFDNQYYLSIQVGSDPEMIPRQPLTSAPYALTAASGVPKGVIVMWSGTIATIPSGWALCDGTNGTPDLRDKFIVGARQDDGGIPKTNISGDLTQSGGSTTITVNQIPAHSHASRSGSFVHSSGGGAPSATGGGEYDWQSTTADTGGGQPYTQPYYALAYIMKV